MGKQEIADSIISKLKEIEFQGPIETTDDYIIIYFESKEKSFDDIQKDRLLSYFRLTREQIDYIKNLSQKEIEELKKLIRYKQLKEEMSILEKEINT